MIPYVIEKDYNNQERVYDLYSRLLKDRIIFVSGEFNDVMANSIVAQLLFLHSTDPGAEIQMYINSPGGSVYSMFAIYDTMQHISPDIRTIGLGTVASAGSFILAAGTKGKRQLLKNTDVMIHEFSGGAGGKANDIFNTVTKLKKLYANMAKYYVDFTGQSLKKIKKDMERDYWLDAKEAVAYGLADSVI